MQAIRTTQLRLPASREYAERELFQMAAEQLKVPVSDFDWLVLRRSIDARKQPIYWNFLVGQYEKNSRPTQVEEIRYRKVGDQPRVDIIGCGPAGLFAALQLLEKGIKPVIWERGKDVRERRRDLAEITRNHKVDPHSNYCFGEGGAGTYSDGKLYTRSKKRGSIKKVLSVLVHHGADDRIMVDAHPHIGTNKLPGIIQTMRRAILDCGGEIHFGQWVSDIRIADGRIIALQLNENRWEPVDKVILATGHSARDIFELLNRHGLNMDFKPFAVGVRIEHDQRKVDRWQYHLQERPEHLPPASYALVEQVEERGVFSFCMCPGGIIAPCATGAEEVVTNGWSPSKRDNPWANAGIVVQVEQGDLETLGYTGPLAGVRFQHDIEHKAWEMAGKSQKAPGQRVGDFLRDKTSESLPDSSYLPGITSVNLHELFPPFIARRLQGGLREFHRKMKGFAGDDALLVAPETRTSSPVRIPRDPKVLSHPEVSNLYPCGEGAGYAGGIVSAAMDGERCALACITPA